MARENFNEKAKEVEKSLHELGKLFTEILNEVSMVMARSEEAYEHKYDVFLVSRHEAAEMLGVSLATLNRMSNGGCIPRIREGARGVKYDKRDIYAYIKKQRGATYHNYNVTGMNDETY